MARIVTESTADIPVELVEELQIAVVPAYVVFGSETFRDGIDLSRQQFYEKLETTHTIPTTATPPPTLYGDVYHELLRETDEIVSIHLAANLSALCDVARAAAREIPDARIAVVDSAQVTMGYGWIVVAAAEAAQQGATLPEIVGLVEELKGRARVLAVLDTLEYVHRGGRVGWTQAVLGTLMRIKPIIEIRWGEIVLLERARTRSRSLARLLDLIRDLGSLERAVVLHTNAPDRAESLADELQSIHPNWERLIAPAGVTVASHAGPGALGLACITMERRD